ncbi:TPA: hypothetical protein ACKQH2_005124 [Serratia marcescens]|nr:hypothetical protein [Salmonella enterica]
MNIMREIKPAGNMSVRAVLAVAMLSCLTVIGVGSWLLAEYGWEALVSLADGSAFSSANSLRRSVVFASLLAALVSLLAFMAVGAFDMVRAAGVLFWLFAGLLSVSFLAGLPLLVEWFENVIIHASDLSGRLL